MSEKMCLKTGKRDTPKSMGKESATASAFIIRRLPVRFTYDNNYFNDRFQGIALADTQENRGKDADGIPQRRPIPTIFPLSRKIRRLQKRLCSQA